MDLHSFIPKVAVPSVVYHYTSAASFLSITKVKSLRAGSTLSLNDMDELIPGREALRKIAERCDRGSVGAMVWDAVNDPDVSNSDDEQSVYVLSASSAPDDAAQWINYAEDGRGYAIGIRTEDPLVIESGCQPGKGDSVEQGLYDLSVGFGSTLSPWVPVLYHKDEIEEAFQELFDWAEGLYLNAEGLVRKLENADSQDEAAELFFEKSLVEFEVAAAAHSVIHRVKSEPWMAEQEYRRIAVLHSAKPLMRFRSAAAGITSYVDLVGTSQQSASAVEYVDRTNGTRGPVQLPISEVICGPRAGAKPQRDLVKTLLAQRGLDRAIVRPSRVLLR